jgi:hypothetical protein
MRATELHIDTPKPPATCATTRSAVTNGKRLHSHVDGRTSEARRFRDLIAAFEAEIPGQLGAIEKGLVRSAAGLQLQAEAMQAAIVRGDPNIDPDTLIRLTGAARRILQAISAKAAARKPAQPSLAEHLARRAAEKRAAAEGEVL